MRILKNKLFSIWAKAVGLKDTSLIKAIDEMQEGLYEASLGGNIYKKRIALKNQGKRGGARSIIAFKTKDKAIFIYGFAKNKKENITAREEEALKNLAKLYFSYDKKQIEHAIKTGEFVEVLR